MNLHVYGKKFLNYYNKVEGTNFSAKDFFNDVAWNLYFNDVQERHLFLVTNSLFANPGKKKSNLDYMSRLLLKEEFNNNLKLETYFLNSAYLVGGSGGNYYDTTSFNKPLNVKDNISNEDYYYSWIAYALGLTVNNIYCFFIDDVKIMYEIFKSHYKYRELLNDEEYENYSGKQIHQWNTMYLIETIKPLFDIDDYNPFETHVKTQDKKEYIKLSFEKKYNDWWRLIYALSQKSEKKVLNSHIISFGQTTKNIGFFKLLFNKSDNFFDFFKSIFNEEDVLDNFEIYKLFMGGDSLNQMLVNGVFDFGILKFDYNGIIKLIKKNNKNLEFKDKILKLFKLYLNMKTKNDELYLFLEEMSNFLIEIEKERRTNDISKIIKEIFDCKNKLMLLEQLTRLSNSLKDEKYSRNILEIYKKINIFASEINFKEIILSLNLYYNSKN